MIKTAMEIDSKKPVASDLCPLFVDMDGTLVSTDLLWENVMLFASRYPLQLALLPLWLIGGKANLKRRLAERVIPDASHLPYREDVVEFLLEEKKRSRELYLATASNEQIAAKVAAHLAFFNGVLASSATTNLSGKEKLNAILKQCEGGRFAYMGNSNADIPLWQKAAESYVVSPGSSLLRKAKCVCDPKRIFPAQGHPLKALIKALRPHQWVKNLLIAVPLFAAHKVTSTPLLWQMLLSMAAFSMCASAVYICNDLLDLDADRRHPRKRFRPFAAGSLSIPTGIAAAILLVAGAFILSLVELPSHFTILLVLYLCLTTAYSAYFKRRLLQDVFLLAGLYTLRILAGGAAVGVEISPWLLGFSLFFFLSLAFVKRYSELLIVMDRDQTQASGRDYIVQDMEVLASVGPTSGYIAVLVMCLYINSDVVRSMYKHPAYLWSVCPILLFWITRIWFLARRQGLADDPVVFAMRDRVSIIAGIVMGIVFVLSV